MHSSHIKDTIGNYRNMYPPIYVFSLKLDDVVIRVSVNNRNLERELKSYFREFIVAGGNPLIEITALEAPPPSLLEHRMKEKEPDGGKNVVKEEYLDFDDGRIVRKRLTGMVFFFNGRDNLAIGPATANSNQLVNFINNRFIEYKLNKGMILLHAAGVCSKEKGLAISGFSGTGKSTLALQLMNLNLNFVSNDRLLVKNLQNRLQMFGIAKYPRINPGTIMNNERLKPVLGRDEIERYESLSTDELWKTEKKYDLFIDSVYGKGRFNISSPMNTLVILNWQRNSSEITAVKEVSITERKDLYRAFIKQPGLFYYKNGSSSPAPGSGDISDIFLKCRVYEVTGKTDFTMVTDTIMKLLN